MKYYTEYLYTPTLIGYTGWSKWLLWLTKTLRNRSRWHLAWFQISHIAMGWRAHHIITTFSMSTSTESMLLSLLSAPSFIEQHTVTRALYQKEHYLTLFWRDFWRPKMLKNPNFLEEFTGRAYIAPMQISSGRLAAPFPITPLPFSAFRLGLASTVSQSQTHYKVVNRKYDYRY